MHLTTLSYRAAAAVSCTLALGCSVATEEAGSREVPSSTHALIQVRSQQTSGSIAAQYGGMGGAPADEPTQADALATFVRAPTSADPAEVLALAGIRNELPPAGQCLLERRAGYENGSSLAGVDFADVELVDAEWVQLETPAGVHELAPHAFPTVTDWIRGVVYASRSREGAALPANEEYRISATAIEGLGDLEALHDSPPRPSGIAIDGVPLKTLTSVGPEPELTINWEASDNPLDLVALRTSLDETHWTCVYRDSEGHGAVPLASPDGEPWSIGQRPILAVHRLRAVASSGTEASSVMEVNFDFSVAAPLLIGSQLEEFIDPRSNDD